MYNCLEEGVYSQARRYIERYRCKIPTSVIDRIEDISYIEFWFSRVLKGKTEYIRMVKGDDSPTFYMIAARYNAVFGPVFAIPPKQQNPTSDINSRRRETDGATLVDIRVAVGEEGQPRPFVSANGIEYYLLIFDDGCEFILTVEEANHMMAPTIIDDDGNRVGNPDFLEKGINVGQSFSAHHDSKSGLSSLKYV